MKLLFENWREYLKEEAPNMNQPYGSNLFGTERGLSEPDGEAEAAMWQNIEDFLIPGKAEHENRSSALTAETIKTLAALKANISKYPPDYKEVLMPKMSVVHRGTKLTDEQLSSILGADIDAVADQWFDGLENRISVSNPFIKKNSMVYTAMRGPGNSWSEGEDVARGFATGGKKSAAKVPAASKPPPLPKATPPPLTEATGQRKNWAAILSAKLSDNPAFIMNYKAIPTMTKYGEEEAINLLAQTKLFKIAYWPIE